jgi:hypothetical protein
MISSLSLLNWDYAAQVQRREQPSASLAAAASSPMAGAQAEDPAPPAEGAAGAPAWGAVEKPADQPAPQRVQSGQEGQSPGLDGRRQDQGQAMGQTATQGAALLQLLAPGGLDMASLLGVRDHQEAAPPVDDDTPPAEDQPAQETGAKAAVAAYAGTPRPGGGTGSRGQAGALPDSLYV